MKRKRGARAVRPAPLDVVWVELAEQHADVFGFDYAHAVSHGDFNLAHPVAGVDCQLEGEAGAGIDHHLTVSGEVVRANFREAASEDDCIAAEAEVFRVRGGNGDGSVVSRSDLQAGFADREHVRREGGGNDVFVAANGNHITREDCAGTTVNGDARRTSRERTVEQVARTRASREGGDLRGLLDAEAVQVQQLAVAQGHRGSGLVRLGQLGQSAEGRASRCVEDDGTVSEGRTVVVKNFLELRGVGEVGGEGSRASRAGGAGGRNTHRGEDGRLDLVRVNAEALGDLVADERGRAGAGGERILFLTSVAEGRHLVVVDHDALGSDGLIGSGSHNHRGRDGRRGVGRGDGNKQGLVLRNTIRIGGAVDGGNQADEFTRHDVEGFVGCGDEVGQCVRHVGCWLFVF